MDSIAMNLRPAELQIRQDGEDVNFYPSAKADGNSKMRISDENILPSALADGKNINPACKHISHKVQRSA